MPQKLFDVLINQIGLGLKLLKMPLAKEARSCSVNSLFIFIFIILYLQEYFITRKSLAECFAKMSCFLMPDPGRAVKR